MPAGIGAAGFDCCRHMCSRWSQIVAQRRRRKRKRNEQGEGGAESRV